MAEKNQELFEEFKEKGIPMYDYCGFCDEGNSLLYVMRYKNSIKYLCDKCRNLSS